MGSLLNSKIELEKENNLLQKQEEQYDEKVINFLNSLKDIQPTAQNFPGYVYKVFSKQNEGLTSILFGTEHNSESFCNLVELTSLADVFYFESTVPEKYIVPKEAIEKG